MMRTQGLKAVFAAVLLASFALGGCVVTARPAYYDGTVMVAPPPPQEEVIGVAPTPGYIWFGGYWGWAGGRHVWVAGHWGAGRPGYAWVPHHWVPAGGGGWRMVQGHWERR
jgi:predicted small secreted protein